MHGIVHVLIGIVINYWKLLLWHSPNSMDNNENAKKKVAFVESKLKKVASSQGIKNLEQQDSEPHQKKKQNFKGTELHLIIYCFRNTQQECTNTYLYLSTPVT